MKSRFFWTPTGDRRVLKVRVVRLIARWFGVSIFAILVVCQARTVAAELIESIEVINESSEGIYSKIFYYREYGAEDISRYGETDWHGVFRPDPALDCRQGSVIKVVPRTTRYKEIEWEASCNANETIIVARRQIQISATLEPTYTRLVLAATEKREQEHDSTALSLLYLDLAGRFQEVDREFSSQLRKMAVVEYADHLGFKEVPFAHSKRYVSLTQSFALSIAGRSGSNGKTLNMRTIEEGTGLTVPGILAAVRFGGVPDDEFPKLRNACFNGPKVSNPRIDKHLLKARQYQKEMMLTKSAHEYLEVAALGRKAGLEEPTQYAECQTLFLLGNMVGNQRTVVYDPLQRKYVMHPALLKSLLATGSLGSNSEAVTLSVIDRAASSRVPEASVDEREEP